MSVVARRKKSSPRPKHRKPGRPSGSAADQRARLLDAALDLYAHFGIDAASLRDIATRAHVTPAMVHYYFGSKDELRDAVLEERLMPLIAGLRGALDGASSEPRDLAARFVRGMHATVAHAPWLPSLWVREVLSEGGALRDVLISRIAPLLPLRLAERFASAQKRGDLPHDLDPRLLVVSLMGLALLPFAAAPLWRRIFSADDIDADALLGHTLALLDHGLGVARAV